MVNKAHSDFKRSARRPMKTCNVLCGGCNVLSLILVELSPMRNACAWVWLWFTARLSVPSRTWPTEGIRRRVCATPQDTQDWSCLVSETFYFLIFLIDGFNCVFWCDFFCCDFVGTMNPKAARFIWFFSDWNSDNTDWHSSQPFVHLPHLKQANERF